MPGDPCFLGGFGADTLTTRAVNHDPQHVPYGICWLESAEAKDESAIEQRAASSSGWGPGSITVHEPLGKTRWTRGEAMGSARCSIAGDTNTAPSSGYATKQPLQAPPMHAAAAVGATEHSHDHSTPEMASQNLPADTKKSDSMEEPAACQPSRRQTIKRCRLE